MIQLMPFSMETFRLCLRSEREDRVGGRERLAELSGVNKTTIQNAELGPDIPGIDTIAKLVEAMPDLTLASFFTRVEGLPKQESVAENPSPLGPAVGDDPFPYLVKEDQIEASVIHTLASLLAKAQEEADGAHHRPFANPLSQAAERPDHRRKRAHRPARRPPKKRPRKR